MRPPQRTQAPTVFQRRWPRARRISELKGVPDTRTEIFCYPMDMSERDVGAAVRADILRVFGSMNVTHAHKVNHIWNRHEVFVSQTKDQRRKASTP